MGTTLLLFNYDWDATGFARVARSLAQPMASRGFNLFSFPSNAHLVWFDIDRFVDKLAAQAKSENWTAVISQHEQFGALASALLAERMGWPGTPSKAVVACQHKLHAREVLQKVCPEANLAYTRLPTLYGEPIPAGLRYPSFVKPVKAAFSVLAKRVHSREELHQFTRFGAYELWIIKKLVEPFERIAKRMLPQASTAHSMMLEEPMQAAQYSLDGIVFEGETKALGVVDSVMYPGTQSFMRFDYPSLLPADIQARALEVARKFLQEVGFSYGIFNMEFFYDAATDQLKVIEFNPRMASQFADLYLRVDGVDLYAMALALAHGQNPWGLPRALPTAGAAASFVYRSFDARLADQQQPQMPSLAQLAALAAQYPDHLLLKFSKTGQSLARDFKWLGSYRYGILHLGGLDAADLQQRCEHASALLGWQAPYASDLSQSAHPTMVNEHPETGHTSGLFTSTPATNLAPLRLSA